MSFPRGRGRRLQAAAPSTTAGQRTRPVSRRLVSSVSTYAERSARHPYERLVTPRASTLVTLHREEHYDRQPAIHLPPAPPPPPATKPLQAERNTAQKYAVAKALAGDLATAGDWLATD
eukprot:4626213-Prymnesium_polylepis.1